MLSFTTSGGYITVIVRNPLADPARYRAEFAAHHLNITLKMVPASPSIVGTVVYIEEPASSPDIETITAQGRCYTGGGGSACPVGVRIPVSFRGQAEVVFGRAARPGEQYESTAPATAPGEVMHGLQFAGDTVAQVLAMLRERHVTRPGVQLRPVRRRPEPQPRPRDLVRLRRRPLGAGPGPAVRRPHQNAAREPGAPARHAHPVPDQLALLDHRPSNGLS